MEETNIRLIEELLNFVFFCVTQMSYHDECSGYAADRNVVRSRLFSTNPRHATLKRRAEERGVALVVQGWALTMLHGTRESTTG